MVGKIHTCAQERPCSEILIRQIKEPRMYLILCEGGLHDLSQFYKRSNQSPFHFHSSFEQTLVDRRVWEYTYASGVSVNEHVLQVVEENNFAEAQGAWRVVRQIQEGQHGFLSLARS